MTRLSILEGMMAVALLLLVGGLVFPRVVQASPEVRSSQASVLEIRLQQNYDLWHISGGVHGPGDKQDPLLLTKNLLACFSAPSTPPFSSAVSAGRSLGYAGVYERPTPSANPCQYRLKGLTIKSPTPVDFVDTKGLPRRGLVLPGNFAVVFDGTAWHVKAIF